VIPVIITGLSPTGPITFIMNDPGRSPILDRVKAIGAWGQGGLRLA
jgi:hypothetical protein